MASASYVIDVDSDSDIEVGVQPPTAPLAPPPQPSLPAASSGTALAGVQEERAQFNDVQEGLAGGDGHGGVVGSVVVGVRDSSGNPSTAHQDAIITSGGDHGIVGRDALIVGHVASEAVTPMQYWSDRIGSRMDEAVVDARAHGSRIRWNIAPVRANVVDWCIAHINDVLDEGYVAAFYIGISHRIAERWQHPHNPSRGHCRTGYQRMVVCAVSDQSDAIGNAEVSVIARFRRFGRSGVINTNGHPLCQNRSPGNEHAHHGVPPFALYVCWRHNPGYRRH